MRPFEPRFVWATRPIMDSPMRTDCCSSVSASGHATRSVVRSRPSQQTLFLLPPADDTPPGSGSLGWLGLAGSVGLRRSPSLLQSSIPRVRRRTRGPSQPAAFQASERPPTRWGRTPSASAERQVRRARRPAGGCGVATSMWMDRSARLPAGCRFIIKRAAARS